MKRGVWWYVSLLLFVVIFAMGGWFRAVDLRRRMPTLPEVSDLWAATCTIETTNQVNNATALTTTTTPFHILSGHCAAFFDEANSAYSLRCYRVVPFVCSLLILGLIPLLGLTRRGGLFDTADGPLWTMAFVAFSPVLIAHTFTFNVLPLTVILFLGLLLTARAYAQWPGYLPATFIGVFCAALLSIDSNTLWLIAALIPAVIVGVGWTRLCLYWQTLHAVTAVVVCGALVALAAFFGFQTPPNLPTLSPLEHSILLPTLRCVGVLCTGGLGIIAWCGLAIGGGFKPEQRWARVFIILFPTCFMGALFFDKGGIFVLPLVLLTPIMAGMALVHIKDCRCRTLLGGLLVLSLFAGSLRMLNTATDTARTREQEKLTLARLRNALTAPHLRPYRVRIISSHPEECAELLWVLRKHVDTATYGSQEILDDADILLRRELGERSGRTDLITLENGAHYRLFITRPTP